MMAAQGKLDTITHNLANVNTVGYKAERVEFSEALERLMRGEGGLGDVIGSLGTGPVESQRFLVRTAGSAMNTSNPLDVAILEEDGAFGVLANGQVQYTRNGSFTINDKKQLVTQFGHNVLDTNQRPIQLSKEGTIKVDSNGLITQDGKTVATLGMWNAPTWQRIGDGLLTAPDATPYESRIGSGMLESSNVNAVEAMVDMIKLSRVFEMSQKAITAEDEASQKLIQGLQQG